MEESSKSNGPDTGALTINPVGYVKSRLKDPSLKADRTGIAQEQGLHEAAAEVKYIRSLTCELVIDPELHGILDGLEDFSHAVVLYWPHLLPPQGRSLTRVHPMGLKQFPLKGVFATCSPARPNPILMTIVRIIDREGNTLTVQGLEAVDGSPIVDLKPYTTSCLPKEEVKMSDWMEQIQQAISKA